MAHKLTICVVSRLKYIYSKLMYGYIYIIIIRVIVLVIFSLVVQLIMLS